MWPDANHRLHVLCSSPALSDQSIPGSLPRSIAEAHRLATRCIVVDQSAALAGSRSILAYAHHSTAFLASEMSCRHANYPLVALVILDLDILVAALPGLTYSILGAAS